MIIKSIQKVIKVGSSLAVTIPAKDAKYYNVQPGENLEISVRRTLPDAPVMPKTTDALQQTEAVVAMTQKLIKRHIIALEHLNQR